MTKGGSPDAKSQSIVNRFSSLLWRLPTGLHSPNRVRSPVCHSISWCWMCGVVVPVDAIFYKEAQRGAKNETKTTLVIALFVS